MTPGLSGATKSARPVASVVRRSPLEKFTVTPGVSRPLTSSTDKVARSPETICRGSSKMRAADAGGGCCATAAKEMAIPVQNAAQAGTLRCQGMQEL